MVEVGSGTAVYEASAQLHSRKHGRPPIDPVVTVKYLPVGFLTSSWNGGSRNDARTTTRFVMPVRVRRGNEECAGSDCREEMRATTWCHGSAFLKDKKYLVESHFTRIDSPRNAKTARIRRYPRSWRFLRNQGINLLGA